MRPLKNNFEKLKVGCLMRSIQKENNEPENIAIGQVSKELRFLQRQSEYVNEIERILKELELAVFLIEKTKQSNTSEMAVMSKQEVMNYYQGIFLTLVHQIKDKIILFVNLITEEKIPKKPAEEDDIKVAKLLKKKNDILIKINIKDEIGQWNQENFNSKIANALKKRSNHHHRVSGLKYNNDFLNLEFTDIMLQQCQAMLNNDGKKQIEKMKNESGEKLFANAEMKAKNILNAIKENIEKISLALVNYFKLPISEQEIAAISKKYINSSFDIENASSLEKIPIRHKELLKNFISKVAEKYQKIIETVYLVGSLGRGEYQEGYSDVNIYIVLLRDNDMTKEIREEIVNDIPYGDELSVEVFSKTNFLSEQCQKYRIITKVDSVLIYGTDLVAGEKKPKAGLLTALMLNDDILDNLDKAKSWMAGNPSASPSEISRESKKLAKCMIDFIYGVVISNKPQYTSNRAERVVKINEMYPVNKKMLEILMNVSKYGVREFKNFCNCIDGFRPNAEQNLNKMWEVKKSIEASRK